VADILVFEDDPVVARMLTLFYSLEGHEVEAATTADAVEHRLEGPAADLLLLDVMLDGADGLEVLRHLRGRPEWNDCGVIVVTALNTDADVWRGWSSGADYYLTKPFDLAHLRSVSHRLLSRGRPVPAGGSSRA
jgi:DNA-binding response OmpR family regulator